MSRVKCEVPQKPFGRLYKAFMITLKGDVQMNKDRMIQHQSYLLATLPQTIQLLEDVSIKEIALRFNQQVRGIVLLQIGNRPEFKISVHG